jgi:hypothetical protein
MKPFETIPFRDLYGTHETNGLEPGVQQELLDSLDGEVYWSDPRLKKIFRLRLLTDRDFPYFDVSYCYGTLDDGTNVRVSLPFHQLTKAKWKTEIVEWATRDGVFAKGLGIFDPATVSTLI